MSLKKVVALIRQNKNFLITTHTNPEGDALGSELAFYKLVRKLGKNAVIVNEDGVPDSYNFLPENNIIRRYKRNLRGIGFDCLVVLDCSDLGRTGEVGRFKARNKPVINIDHHISNDKFGDANWVEPGASSASEMIYTLYKKMKVPFDKDSALLLYVGMVTDTGSFRYTNTKKYTHEAVAELLKYGIDVIGVYRQVYENIPFEDIKLLTRILPTVRRQAKGKIIWFQIKQNMLKNKKLSFDLTEELLSFARSIKDVEVALLFKENLGIKNEIRVNFRSQGKVDVNKVASFFGGGGHRTASGATVIGKIDTVRKKVLAKIKEKL
ncbi:MAG: bifunctional oligoribonuclease/PAP phosphatase NrnA [Candidatus Omnitrophica bacterium]|nr:bifunctional oligoribonuclease/PAP phosphatase NrnA [Candidatus Omnitrophota bacterium]